MLIKKSEVAAEEGSSKIQKKILNIYVNKVKQQKKYIIILMLLTCMIKREKIGVILYGVVFLYRPSVIFASLSYQEKPSQ